MTPPLQALPSLPLFPLGTVLFPDGLLPLRIFEVRYLDMIAKCHRAGTPFGVIGLQSGEEVRRPDGPVERLQAVGTLAHITHYETAQPGLVSIRCVGSQRFRVKSSQQLKHGLWIADAELLPADQQVAVPDDLLPAAQALERLALSLSERQVPPERIPFALPLRTNDCGWLANRWCELLPLSLQAKQQMMELDNPLVRLELVNDLLVRHQIDGTGA